VPLDAIAVRDESAVPARIADCGRRPVPDAVRGMIEHLTGYLTSDPRPVPATGSMKAVRGRRVVVMEPEPDRLPGALISQAGL